jgi:hypothetical protein
MKANKTAQVEATLTDKEFAARVRRLIAGKPVKIWLAKSAGGRLDTVFAAGVAQGEPIKNFDHIGGFYLLGEGVTPDLIPELHGLFTRYCSSHRALLKTHPGMRVVDLRYKHGLPPGEQQKHELVMHIPLSIPTDV